MKKDDLSKSIGEAERAFQQTVQEARARNAHLPPEQIEEIIEEALAEVRAERFASARTKSPK
jgi:hypothetical protein